MNIKSALPIACAVSMILGAVLYGVVSELCFHRKTSAIIDMKVLQSSLSVDDDCFPADVRWIGDRIAAIPDIERRMAELQSFKKEFLSAGFNDKSARGLELAAFRYFKAYRSIMGLCWKCGEKEDEIFDFDFRVLSLYPHLIAMCEKSDGEIGCQRNGAVGAPVAFAMAEDFRTLVASVLRFKNFDKFVDALELEGDKNRWRERLNAITNCPQFTKCFDPRKSPGQGMKTLKSGRGRTIAPHGRVD